MRRQGFRTRTKLLLSVVPLILTLIAGCGGATAPEASASSAPATYVWQTFYAGSYAYSADMGFNDTDPASTSNETLTATYNWAINVVDTFTQLSSHKFKESILATDLSTGQSKEKGVVVLKEGSGNGAPMVTSNITCSVVATGSTQQRSRTGIFGAPSPGGPDALVNWAVPAVADASGQYFFDGTPFDEQRSAVTNDAPGASEHCVDNSLKKRYSTQDGSTLLDTYEYSTTGTIDGNYPWFHYDEFAAQGWKNHSFPSCGGQELTANQQFADLWQGSARVPLDQLPYEKSFHFSKAITGAMSDPKKVDLNATKGHCSDAVNYTTALSFSQLNCGSTSSTKGAVPNPAPNSSAPPSTGVPTPASGNSFIPQGVTFQQDDSHQACNKVGALLLEDGLRIMNGASSQLSQGENVQVLFPGGPEGGSQATAEQAIEVGVTGQVVSSHVAHLSSHASQGSGVTLYQGSANVTPGKPEVVTLRVTPAGKQLLDHSHGALNVTVHLTMTSGSGGVLTSTAGTLALPASG